MCTTSAIVRISERIPLCVDYHQWVENLVLLSIGIIYLRHEIGDRIVSSNLRVAFPRVRSLVGFIPESELIGRVFSKLRE